jgi:glycine hydroxymethyltransferase
MDMAIQKTDPEIFDCIERQRKVDATTLKLIPSENFVSEAVLAATGSVLTNKYCEGYPGARYYEGNEIYDEIERIAVNRLKQVFGAEHANVQPYSGSPANQAVYRALLDPGDLVMGMPIAEGGHLTHGWKVNFSGIDYAQVPYGVDPETGRLDYDDIRRIAQKRRPRLVWIGCTAYSRVLDYEQMAEIAAETGSYLAADIAHISGLIAGGAHPNPVPFCDVVTGTSHKTLRGPRGGFILCRKKDRYQSPPENNLARRIDRAVFPMLQGGPHMNVIAALAVALKEVETPAFQEYAARVVENAGALAQALTARGYRLVSGGTDNHLLLIDFRQSPVSGRGIARMLAEAGIVTNFNMVPGDLRKPFETSGVRMGTPAVTTQGLTPFHMKLIAGWIDDVCRNPENREIRKRVAGEVAELCTAFPPPGAVTETAADGKG